MIPVKCFTCGTVLANKYRTYKLKVRERKMELGIETDKIHYLTKDKCEKTIEGIIMDDFDIHNICCRRIMLTNTDDVKFH